MSSSAIDIETQALGLTPEQRDSVNVSTHPLAEEELVDGAVYYAKQANAALGEDFIGDVERSIALLRQCPKIG